MTSSQAAGTSSSSGGLDVAIPSSSMEMSDLTSSSPVIDTITQPTAATTTAAATADDTAAPTVPAPAHLRRNSTNQIKPATDEPSPSEAATGPAVNITLLLISGNRHPFRVDERYLRKRGIVGDDVQEGSADPFAVSVYTLKELIWRDWRTEWEQRPTSPHSIRLINFGKILEDKMSLSECRFNAEAPTVVHMTVKPQEMLDDEDAKTGKGGYGRDREGSERTPGCRCIIL